MAERLASWAKFSTDDISKYFPIFSQKIAFDSGDNVHDMSKPTFCEK